jgi:3-phenylpropionate/trans-cinnamate dioxygenase ferredoxin reductase component
MSERYALLAIGGGPAGLAAARAYRAQGGGGRVAIVSDEHRMPYQRPPLTKELLRGEASEGDLPIESAPWLAEQRIDLIAGRVVTLDADARVARLSGGRELPYEQCLLATGAEPTRLPVPGADHPAVHVLRTLDHLRELTAHLEDTQRVVVVGSGFIGCEIASSLRARGQTVTLISDELAPNAERLGAAAAEIIGGWLADDGVELRLGLAVEAIEHDDSELVVRAGGDRVPGRIVVMAVGVRPRTELAVQAGLDLRDRAIPTDAAMRTARDGVLAAGDVCVAANLAAGRPLRVEHWGDALSQGEIAGTTAASGSAGWEAVPGFWSTIGRRTLKYAAWGDGFDATHLDRHASGGFTARFGCRGTLIGVLTHEADDDYERGSEQIAEGAPWGF